jgi:hypothetical protein
VQRLNNALAEGVPRWVFKVLARARGLREEEAEEAEQHRASRRGAVRVPEAVAQDVDAPFEGYCDRSNPFSRTFSSIAASMPASAGGTPASRGAASMRRCSAVTADCSSVVASSRNEIF